jgi:putative Holliday junction resolvase
MPQTPKSVLALDVGSVRVGVAIASLVARLPRPLITMQQGPDFFDALQAILEVEAVGAIVVGFPRGMQGQYTRQTDATLAFVQELKEHVALPVFMQDEALTSRHAEAELKARGRDYDKGDIDALAATYILEDFMKEHPNGIEVQV